MAPTRSTVNAANGASPAATHSFVLSVNEGPVLTGPSSDTYVVGTAGGPDTFTATSNPVATISLSGDALPAGVSFTDLGNGSATISGTPSAGGGGVYEVIVTASNGVGSPASKNFELTVNEAPSISGASSLAYSTGAAIAAEPFATNGYPIPALSAIGVPSGLNFSDNGDGTGSLTGTPAAGTGGNHTMTLSAANGVGSPAQLLVHITIYEAPVITGPTARSCQVEIVCGPDTFVVGGYPPSSVILSGDALPSGITFGAGANPGTYQIGGSAAVGTGGIYAIQINATNSAGDAVWLYTLTIGEAPTVSGPTAATYTVGASGSPLDYSATGFPVPILSASGLPAGVILTDHGDGTATIGGVAAPGTGGVLEVLITASNGIATPATTTLTLTINEAPTVTGPTAATYETSVAGATQIFTSTGYPIPSLGYAGALPDGVVLSDNGDGTATLSGTPAAGTGGVYPITVQATNAAGFSIWSFTLEVNQPPAIAGDASARWEIGSASTVDFTTTGYPERTLNLAGDLPSGVGFFDNADNTGTLAGTPDIGTEGVYVVTITADNGVNPPAEHTFTLSVVSPVTITTGDLSDAAIGTPYSVTLTAAGGQPPYTWDVAVGPLPSGLTLSPAGVLGGTPDGPTGTFTFTVRATDSLAPTHAGTKQLTLSIGRGSTQMYVAPAILKLSGLKIKLLTVSVSLLGPTRQPLVGEPITFYAGHTKLCTALTGAAGTASCGITVPNEINAVLNLGYTAFYAGSPSWQPANGASGLIR